MVPSHIIKCPVHGYSVIHRGYLLFEVNTKYISSNVMKISVNSRVRSKSKISDIFNT